MIRIEQQIMNDILKDIKIEINYAPYKNGFHTSVSCSKLYNMDDKEFKNKYLKGIL